MKLRYKIIAYFLTTVIVVLLASSIIIGVNGYNSSMEIVSDSVASSADLAADQIACRFDGYMSTVKMVGTEEFLNSDLSPEEKKACLQKYVDAYGFTSGNILDGFGVSILDGTDFADRDYVQKALKGEVNVSDITLSKLTGAYGVSVAAPIIDSNNAVNGVVYFRMDVDFIRDITDNIKVSENSYAYLVGKDGTVIFHPNEELIDNANITDSSMNFGEFGQKILSEESGAGEYIYGGNQCLCGFNVVDNTNGWRMLISAPESDFDNIIKTNMTIIPIVVVIAVLLTSVVSIFIAGSISKPINVVKNAMEDITKGKLDTVVPKNNHKDEAAILQNMSGELMATLKEIISILNRTLGDIAQYNLRVPDVKHFEGEYNSLADSANSIKYTLTKLIAEIQNAANGVDVGSKELSRATAALSQGTLTQANSIQTLADDLNVVVDVINRNSEREGAVNKKLGNLDSEIKTINEQMNNLMNAVNDIENLSSSIQKIVGTIDGIAFQTNILSLNASVEAARAGDMGSGFAVVAEEVRNLAIQCSDSSGKTGELISNCIDAINHAKKCADETALSIESIVADSEEIAVAFEQISKDTQEQAEKSGHIKAELGNISDVVQTNTATAEETAASTEDLSNQAANLEDMISKFAV